MENLIFLVHKTHYIVDYRLERLCREVCSLEGAFSTREKAQNHIISVVADVDVEWDIQELVVDQPNA
jgi:hypothetical protein